MAKRGWSTPQLIVLARGTPEENVLLHCKAIGFSGMTLDATDAQQVGCDYPPGTQGKCGACQSRGSKS